MFPIKFALVCGLIFVAILAIGNMVKDNNEKQRQFILEMAKQGYVEKENAWTGTVTWVKP